MKIHFSGAAHEVTGSKHLLEINGKFILLDCGLFQGKRKEADIKNRNLNFDPSTLDAVIVSHAHLDHCGNLPYLTKHGYTGKIFMTHQSSDIIPIMLQDSAYIQELDAKHIKKYVKNHDKSIPLEPLYTQEDIPKVVEKFIGKQYEEKFEIVTGVFVKFYPAGHILGSAVVEVSWKEQGQEKILVFTGDLGRPEKNMLLDAKSPPRADFLITESTYGNRRHETQKVSTEKLAEIINRSVDNNGKILIPAFSLQRTQEIIYDLHLLQEEGKIPNIPVFVDSPLAIKVTQIYKKYRYAFDEETREDFFSRGEVPLESEYIKYTPDVEDSKKIKFFKGPCIIVAASGMCEGGRIRHHLMNEITKPENTILFVGYQAAYTLGRRILEKRPAIKIFNQYFPVKAKIEKINGYSGHADYKEILDFIAPIKGIKRIFIVHGEAEQSYSFAGKLRKIGEKENKNWVVDVPETGEVITPETCVGGVCSFG